MPVSTRFIEYVVIGAPNWDTISGSPRSRILRYSGRLTVNLRMRSTPFFCVKCVSSTITASTCDAPVANAAPAMPFCSG